MSLFFPSKPSTPPAASHPVSHMPEPRKLGYYDGNVSARELKQAGIHLRGEGLTRRETAIIDEAIAPSVRERGSQRGATAGEVEETFDRLLHDASKLRISKEHLEVARGEIMEKL